MTQAETVRSQPFALRRETRRSLAFYLAICSGMLLLLYVYFLAKSKAFAFVDIGSDTYYCFYPLQVAISHQLQTLHSVTWSFELGLGGFLGTLFDPFWLIFGWLPESWQLALRAPMYALHLLMAGAFFHAYLRMMRFSSAQSIVGGLCYAFCSYALVNAQWEVMHGTEYLQFAVYLYLFERFLQGGTRWCAIGAGIVVGLGHPLGLYMFPLFSVVYALARQGVQHFSSWRSLFGRAVSFGVWCVVGLAVTAPLLGPAFYYFIESPRVTGSYSQLHHLSDALFSLQDLTVLKGEIGALLGKDLMGGGMHYLGWGNYFESPGFYVGLLPLICLPQLFGPHATRGERRLGVIGLLGIALYIVWPALRFAVYGFGQFAFRFSTLWISVLLLVMGLAGWRRAERSGVWRTGLVTGAAAVLAIASITVIFLPQIVNMEHVLRVAAFVALYTTLLALLSRRLHTIGAALLISAAACELLLFAIPPIIERDAVGADGSSSSGRFDDGTAQALAIARADEKSGTFYRIERTFDSVFLDDALVQHYHGTQSYYFHATPITRFVDSMALPRITPSPNYISSMAERRDVLDLLDVKYVLARNRSLDGKRDLTFIGRGGNIDVYRNETAHAFGTFLDRIEDESAANALPIPQRDRFLLSAAVALHAPLLQQRLDAMKRDAAAQPDLMPATSIHMVRDDQLEGDIVTPSAKLLLLAMPYDRGWHATLDDQAVEVFEADYGLTALLVPTGRHRLGLHFAPLGRNVGWIVCAAALLLLVFIRLRSRRMSRAHLPTPNAGNATSTNEAVETASDAASNIRNAVRGSAVSA